MCNRGAEFREGFPEQFLASSALPRVHAESKGNIDPHHSVLSHATMRMPRDDDPCHDGQVVPPPRFNHHIPGRLRTPFRRTGTVCRPCWSWQNLGHGILDPSRRALIGTRPVAIAQVFTRLVGEGQKARDDVRMF